jgi:acyl-CoA hydrolase
MTPTARRTVTVQIVSEAKLRALLGARPGLPRVPRVVAGGNFATPWRALAILDETVAEYRLFMLNAQAGVPDRDGVTLESPFVGPGMRGRERLQYFPCRLSLVPVLLAGALPPDIVLVQTSAPAGGTASLGAVSLGTVSLGTEVNVLPAAIEAAHSRGGLVIAQINPNMPYTYGDAVLPAEAIDYAIEADVPLPSPPPRPVPDACASIGDRVAALVPDGATLQLGIGAVPDAVLAALCLRRDLKVWSEMFSDGVLALEKTGALEPGHLITASFAFGSAELYDWMDRNPSIRMMRTETINDPAQIALRPQMTSVNSALQVDLFAQANASRVHDVIYSGFGGQPDFVVGALHSPGGLAIIALPSWHPKADTSTVVPRLAGPVTSFQHSYIVSDQGAATIWGHDAASQAGQIIAQVAHPSVRDGLREAGRELGFRL